MKTRDKLVEIMGQYTVDNVIVDPDDFEAKIKNMLKNNSWSMEGYKEKEIEAQRKYSLEFEWGHNHDFGTFQVDGILGDRHIDLIETFVDDFGLPIDLRDKNVLDVGAWCGGTTMLLAGMGAKVIALEEVRKYMNCIQFLSRMFGRRYLSKNPQDWNNGDFYVDISKKSRTRSVYDLKKMDFFDYIIFPGVLYHLSDPLVALRILFNALKDGGQIFIETMAYSTIKEPSLKFMGGKGNNWFVPSSTAVIDICEAVGFESYTHVYGDERLIASATRNEWKPMLRAGLSRRVR